MSFLKRLAVAVLLLVLLGIPLSAIYYDSAQTLKAQSGTDPSDPPDSDDATGEDLPAEESTG